MALDWTPGNLAGTLRTLFSLGAGTAKTILGAPGAGALTVVTTKLYPPAGTDPVGPPAPTDGDRYYNTTTKAWRWYDASVPAWRQVSYVGNFAGMNSVFTASSGAPFIEVNSATYETIGMLAFWGTSNGPSPAAARVAMSRSNNTNTVDARIQDVTNAVTIAEGTGFAPVAGGIFEIFSLSAPSGLSATPATWEMQIRRSGGSGTRARASSLSMVF